MDRDFDVESARTPLASQPAASYGATALTSLQSKKNVSSESLQSMEKSKKKEGSHSYIYSMLRYHSHHTRSIVWRNTVRALVWISTLNFVVEDTPYCYEHWWWYLAICEVVCSCFFLVEYGLQIGTVEERKQYRDDPANARLQFLLSSESLIDALSCLPFFVSLILGFPPFDFKVGIVGIIRLVRLMKLHEFWWSFRLVIRVFYYNHVILQQAFMICFMMLVFTAVWMYYCRPVPDDPQENFTSIVACFYLSSLLLSGQGMPDGILPWYTRIVIGVGCLFAIAQFAIPASMLTWGFENEAELAINKRHDKEIAVADKILHGGHRTDSSSSSDESDRKDEWDDYLGQLLGDDFEAEGKGEEDEKPDDPAEGPGEKKQAQQEMVQSMAKTPAKCLTFDELRTAKIIFNKLDTKDTGALEVEQLRCMCKTDRSAVELKELLASFTKESGDTTVTLREFLIWLGTVKKDHKRHGDGTVLQRLFDDIEEQLNKKYAKATSRWKMARSKLKVLSAVQEQVEAGAEAPKAALTKSQQIQEIAAQMGKLEGANAALQLQVASLEKELAAARAAKLARGG